MAYIILIVALINLTLSGIGIFRIPRRYFFKNYFVSYGLLTVAWLISNLLIITRQSYLWLKISYAIGSVMIAAAVLMALSFSQQQRVKRPLRLQITAIGFGIGVMSMVPGLFFKKGFKEAITSENVNSVFTTFFVVYILFLFSSIIFFIYKMYTAVKRFQGIEKKQAKSIFIGILSFGSFSFIFSFLLPAFGFSRFIFMDTVGTLFIVGFIAYAIFRYRLMNIELIIRRSTLYGVLIGFVTIIYLGSIYLFEWIFQGVFKYQSLITRFLAALAIALTFLPLRNRIESVINRLFFRTTFEYSKALKVFSEKLITILDLRDLMGTIVENIALFMQVEHVALMAFDKTQRRYQVKASIGFPPAIRSLEFNQRNLLIRWLKDRRTEDDQFAVMRELLEAGHTETAHIIESMKLLKAEICIPLFFDEKLIGVLSISEKKSGDVFIADEFSLLRTLSNQASVALANAFAYDELKKSYMETIEALAKAIEAKDEYTRGHSDRVVKLSIEMAKIMNIPREEIDLLKYAGILHDVGKIAIDDGIIRKKEKLDEHEWIMMKTHPSAGATIIAPITFLELAGPVIRHHHERWDGNGYPDRLSGEKIPLLSRIISVADTYDAITSARPYRPALTHEYAMEEIKRCSGSQFDPGIVDSFFRLCSSGIKL